MIDRLCALADMPKPRVGDRGHPVPNAFATGRSPERAVVCVTTGILGMLTAEELEGVLAHELSHVAHRDVLVMTVASIGRHRRRHAGPGRAVRHASSAAGVAATTATGCRSGWSCWSSASSVYAVSFVLLRLLSRYRELVRGPAGAYLTMKPGALASALQKITGEINQIPQRDLRQVGAASALCIAPAISGVSLKTLTSTHPSLEQRLEQLARIQAELSRRRPEIGDRRVGLWETMLRTEPAQARQPGRAVPGAERGDHAADSGRVDTDRRRLGVLPSGRRRRVPRDPGRHRRRCWRAPRTSRRSGPTPDEFGFTWLEVRRAPDDPEGMAGLCTDLHGVNTTLESEGFGPGLLCSLIPFVDLTGRRVGLVYLYKKGTFYPFAPTGPQQRDNLLELQVGDTLRGELPIEPELSGWMALWGAPGL